MRTFSRNMRALTLEEILLAEKEQPGTIKRNKKAIKQGQFDRGPYFTFHPSDRNEDSAESPCGCFYGNGAYINEDERVWTISDRAANLAIRVKDTLQRFHPEMDTPIFKFTPIEELLFTMNVTFGDTPLSGPIQVQRFLRWFYRLLEIAEEQLAANAQQQ